MAKKVTFGVQPPKKAEQPIDADQWVKNKNIEGTKRLTMGVFAYPPKKVYSRGQESLAQK